uniref:Uncharacterized protein n=1 Tax=Chromera velia CCMP2878 TaxID=1169474 RepID=A0A0G4FDB0_9ALVE|eukprot:Cvel_3224.t1-p1 / transcript=Cvel_3224.t1 / gene=Cvel_3224 / organism=Chromera_velia_CCMP2878 / gene_product=hypothetical protein / transcript_product=hypothetical protein / location=Cvel_scaffold126:48763-51615(+) / protein_length=123 / sequence_SO=supercontig / SO=protein_coding / is_pseudo=false
MNDPFLNSEGQAPPPFASSGQAAPPFASSSGQSAPPFGSSSGQAAPPFAPSSGGAFGSSSSGQAPPPFQPSSGTVHYTPHYQGHHYHGTPSPAGECVGKTIVFIVFGCCLAGFIYIATSMFTM